MPSEKQYVELYRSQRTLLEAGSCPTLNQAREKAAEELERFGLPIPK
jgi:hypothetical protein